MRAARMRAPRRWGRRKQPPLSTPRKQLLPAAGGTTRAAPQPPRPHLLAARSRMCIAIMVVSSSSVSTYSTRPLDTRLVQFQVCSTAAPPSPGTRSTSLRVQRWVGAGAGLGRRVALVVGQGAGRAQRVWGRGEGALWVGVCNSWGQARGRAQLQVHPLRGSRGWQTRGAASVHPMLTGFWAVEHGRHRQPTPRSPPRSPAAQPPPRPTCSGASGCGPC